VASYINVFISYSNYARGPSIFFGNGHIIQAARTYAGSAGRTVVDAIRRSAASDSATGFVMARVLLSYI